MGWWDTGILGGDTPLDVLGDIAYALTVPNDEALDGNEDPNDYGGFMLYPIEQISPEHGKRIAKAIKADWKKIKDIIVSYYKSGDEFGDIAVQVVGVLIMASGAAFPRGFKKIAIQAAKNDEWAKTREERKMHMDAFIEAVNSYKTEISLLIDQTGLFEKMAEVLG